MVRTSVSLTSVTTSAVIPLDIHNQYPTTILLSSSGTATFSAEVTLDNVLDSTVTPVWVAATGLSGITAASTLGKIDYPVHAVRLNVTAYTSGTVTMRVLEGFYR